MPPTAREELIEEIKSLPHMSKCFSRTSIVHKEIADFILAKYVKKECLIAELEIVQGIPGKELYLLDRINELKLAKGE